MALGAKLHEVHAEDGAGEHQRDADLGGVADEGELAVLDALALGDVLEHGEKVAHLLRRVVVLGHAVEHGSRGTLGETDDVLVTVDASHHDVEQRAHDAGGVAEGLVAAELDGPGAEELGMAAEVAHRGLERDARAG